MEGAAGGAVGVQLLLVVALVKGSLLTLKHMPLAGGLRAALGETAPLNQPAAEAAFAERVAMSILQIMTRHHVSQAGIEA